MLTYIRKSQQGQIGLRARATLDESPEATREVRLAIARAKEGDREALRLLYVRYSDNVYGYVRSIVRDEKEAEDLTQHVFLKLITVIHKYEARGVPFTSWILRVARNVAVDHLRQRRAVPCEEVFEPSLPADDCPLWWLLHQRPRYFVPFEGEEIAETFYLTVRDADVSHIQNGAAGIEVVRFEDYDQMWTFILEALESPGVKRR